MNVRAACLALCLLSDFAFSHPVLAFKFIPGIGKGTNNGRSGSQATPIAASRSNLLASEAGANSVAIPQQILRTGINIFSSDVSANSRQLADSMGLTPLFERISKLRARVSQNADKATLESLMTRQDLSEALIQVDQMILEASLDIDFVLAEITAEQTLYGDILASYQNDRDKVVMRANAASYYANGALWAICEGLDIPTYRFPRYSISSGTVGILAGVVPSALSLYAMRKFNGKKENSEVAPNMLTKLFDYPTVPEIEYPTSVWAFLNSAPADENTTKTRRDQLIHRWVTDKNIPNFTDRHSKKDLDVITASVSQGKGLSIDVLNVRHVMLTQLGAELMKMKRLLLELMMVARDEKHL